MPKRTTLPTSRQILGGVWVVYRLVVNGLAFILANSVTLLFPLPILLVTGSNNLAGRE